MRIDEITNLLEADVLACDMASLSQEADFAFASDFLSDVLAFGRPGYLLLTGLLGCQLVRTAEMSGIAAVVFVRGKRPTHDMVELAHRSGLPLLCTKMTMYEACGRLYQAGVGPADCTSVRGS
ncbi:MAG TPA: DRTGG domain-containing protein [Bacillota bacterium]|nr:DRTGG domain-containing protein [Bacillota bacterium]